MRIALVVVLVFLALSVGADCYIVAVMRRRLRGRALSRIYLVITAILYLAVAVGLLLPRREGSDAMLAFIMWTLFTFMSVYFAKYIFVVFDLVASLPCLFRRHRWRWLSRAGIVVGLAVCGAMWWGALYGRFQTAVREVIVEVPGLPRAFEGLRIVQISDLHLGTYGGDIAFVEKVVAEVDSLRPDIVVFTGDMVNRNSREMLPFVDVLSKIKATGGVYAILGNHDYGDYTDWPSAEAKQANMEVLYGAYKDAGWRLLRNETAWVVSGTDSLAIIGVENVGDPPFPTYGDLRAAYRSIGDSLPKILLTHNPAHWTSDICGNDRMNIALTLTGHTHAMQIELLGLSPAAWRYPTWGGYYMDESHRHPMYVNIGLGTVGFPARIGATPEITLITLARKKNAS